MKGRKFILIVLGVMALFTGYLEYTHGTYANVNDWQNRSLYIDLLRPFFLPASIGFSLLLAIVSIYIIKIGDKDAQMLD